MPILLFDGDCGFCTASVEVLQRWVRPSAKITPWQFADLDALGVSREACESSVQWVRSPGDVVAEAAAVAGVLATGRAPWPAVGRVLLVPGFHQLTDALYRLIARNRYRLPGSTPACRVTDHASAVDGGPGVRP